MAGGIKLLDAGGTSTGAGSAFDFRGVPGDYEFTVEGTGTTITAGEVQWETAPSTGYSGTWAALGASVVAAVGISRVVLSGPFRAVRPRVTEAVAGTGSPSVTCRVQPPVAWLVLLALLGLAAPLEAQTGVVFKSTSGRTTIDANGECSDAIDVEGIGTVRIQSLDTYSGTWEVQGSVDGQTFDTDDEINLVLDGQTSTAQSVTDLVGIWLANTVGLRRIRICSTAGFAATDVTIAVFGASTGGGGGSGGTGSSDIATLAGGAFSATNYLPARLTDGTNYLSYVTQRCADDSKIANVEISETAATGNVSVVAIDGSEVIYVCGYNLTVGGASVVTWETGTGATCGTGTEVEVTLDFNADGDGISSPNGSAVQFKSDAGDRLCINRASSVAISGSVTYVQE